MGKWLVQNTDKLMLYTLVLLAGAVLIHVIHHGTPDAGILSWAENMFSTILGALILMLTGRQAVRSGDTNGNANGNGKPQEPTNAAPTNTQPQQ